MHPHARRFLLAALALLPTIAAAHPGHSAFDPTIAPHAGHEWELLLVLGSAIGILAGGIRAFLKARR